MSGNQSSKWSHRLINAFLNRWKAARLYMLVFVVTVIGIIYLAGYAVLYFLRYDSALGQGEVLQSFGLLFVMLLLGIVGIWQEAGRSLQGESLRQRADRLTIALQRAMASLADTSEELQHEAENSKRLVAKLAQDAKTYEELARVNRSQAEAVANLVRGEFKRQGRRSFWSQLAMSAFFFLAGVLVSRLLGGG